MRDIFGTLRAEWQRTKLDIEGEAAKLKALVAGKGARLKHGGETEAGIKEVFGTVVCRDLIEQCVALTAAGGDARRQARAGGPPAEEVEQGLICFEAVPLGPERSRTP